VNLLRYAAQGLLYVPFMAAIGYFSTDPPYRHLEPDQALVRLSIRHAGERREECRERTPEELAKLPPNMRAPLICPRERVPVTVELEMDGKLLLRTTAPPSGLARDLASIVYWRQPVAAGPHRFVARLNDRRTEGFSHVAEATVTLEPGDALVIDFQAEQGGFLFHSRSSPR
jgi:hypothetical protein